jgi:hypothetical protein
LDRLSSPREAARLAPQIEIPPDAHFKYRLLLSFL